MVERLRRSLLLLAAVVATCAPALANAGPGGESHPNRLIEDVVVQRVRWPLIVEPARGASQRCAALRPEDIELREDGQTARVTAIDASRSDTLYVLLLDVSRSMDEHVAEVRKAVQEFVHRLGPRDGVAIYAFSKECERLLAPSHEPGAIDAAARQIQLGEGFTALVDALYEVLDELSPLPERKAIVLITDGEENSSTRFRRNQLVQLFERRDDVRVFPLVTAGIDNLLDTGMLHVIAASTGGRFELVNSDRSLPAVLDRVRQRIESEVLVTYAPPPRPPVPQGHSTLTLRVKVKPAHGVPCRIKAAVSERVVPLSPE